MLNKKFKLFKLILILNLFLFLIVGIGIAAHHLFFTRIEIKIDEIEWIDEFTMTIPELELDNKPCFLIVESENSKIVSEREFQIQKQNIKIGECTNSRILIPLKIESEIENNEKLFFIPQFKARIKGGEKTQEEDLRLRADFSLYLLTKTNNCPENRERIQLKNNNVLCALDIYSSNVRSFSITERRKNILSNAIKNMADKYNYVLVLKISPDLEIVKTLSYFSIVIENITPELKVGK